MSKRAVMTDAEVHAVMKLSKRHKAAILQVRFGNLSTVMWRDFVPLSNKGLLEIDDEENIFGMRRITLTEKGREVLASLQTGGER